MMYLNKSSTEMTDDFDNGITTKSSYDITTEFSTC